MGPSLNYVVKNFEFFDPPPPYVVIFIREPYILMWFFGGPPSPSYCPRGLRMAPVPMIPIRQNNK